jgi:hypothetical protein
MEWRRGPQDRKEGQKEKEVSLLTFKSCTFWHQNLNAIGAN